jgi:hypothetical protein
MISANVIKGVHELLEERGIRPQPDETFGDVVAIGTPSQHSGVSFCIGNAAKKHRFRELP